ncbi:MAG TPA: hypothetical protein VEW26_07015, partial [Allosphingosinicella sp.]|nr:hypothetical protein [Allosphingosinicella sp.]
MVNERAIPEKTSLADQLRIAGIGHGTSRGEARAAIQRSLTPPTEHETALEMVTGLIFSPDGRAVFRAPEGGPLPDRPTIWAAQLDPEVRTSVRAVWAPGTNLALVRGDDDQPAEPFQLLPNPCDRRGIVLLSSAYGIAGLRALSATGSDMPSSLVQLPEERYDYLSGCEAPLPNRPSTEPPIKVRQEGIIVPAAFRKFEAELTALGGNLDADWKGEPPRALDPDPASPDWRCRTVEEFFHPDFNIESYVHRTRLGRDVFVEVRDKGYWFPHGFRVSYVRLVQRRFLPFRDEEGFQDPTAYLVMRRFIVAKVPEKKLPGLYQPFEGREFPAREMKLITLRTPDLVEPQHLNLGRAAPEEYVFWPRTAEGTLTPNSPISVDGTNVDGSLNYGSEVAVRYEADRSRTPRSAHMMFVSNAAIGNPGLMRKLADYYRQLGGHVEIGRLAREEHGGGDTTYADSPRIGDTTFTTRTVFLGVTGRVRKTAAGDRVEEFNTDAFMEGADQPPFYPVMDKADIRIQSLDRLTGKVHEQITVEYDRSYVEHEFDPAHNPSELYLRVVEPAIDLDVSGQGATSGGVVKPNAMLAALSRKIGFVGGRQTGPGQGGAAPLAGRAAGSRVDFKLDAAGAGRFDPTEFFGGALTEAKLLGILSLKDVIRATAIEAAPELVETLKYGMAKRDELVTKLRAAAAALREVILEARSKADAALAQFHGATLRDFYPELDARIREVGEAAGAAGAATEATALEAATRLYRSCTGLLDSIRHILDNPVPSFVSDALAKIHDVAAGLSAPLKLIEMQIKQALRAVLEEGQQMLLDGLFEAIVEQDAFETLFGPLDAGADPLAPNRTAGPPKRTLDADERARRIALLRSFVRDPTSAFARAGETLFYERLAGPLARALGAYSGISETERAVLEWSRRDLSELIAAELRKTGETLVEKAAETNEAFQQFVGRDLRAPCLAAGAVAMVGQIETVLAPPLGDDPLADLETRLSALPAALRPVLARMAGPAATPAGQRIAESIAGDIERLGADLQQTLHKIGAPDDPHSLAGRLRAPLKPADRKQLELEFAQLLAERDAANTALAQLG